MRSASVKNDVFILYVHVFDTLAGPTIIGAGLQLLQCKQGTYNLSTLSVPGTEFSTFLQYLFTTIYANSLFTSKYSSTLLTVMLDAAHDIIQAN